MIQAIERAMRMDETSWQRHANPLSGYSRFTILPLLVGAVWCRAWIGWWSLVPVALVLLWTWWNPRAFRVPERTDYWVSKGVLGERLFLARKSHPIPRHHERMAWVLVALMLVGVGVVGYGLASLRVWPTLTGMVVVMMAKTWFVDRMVWLYQDMAATNAPSSRRE